MPTALGGTESIRQWVIHHDDSWLFIGGYVAIAVVLSIYSLFWLVVVGIHFILELGRQQARFDDRYQMVAEALWEVKLDLALTVFALALTLYLSVVFGVLGLSSTRAAAGSRAAASAKRATKGAHVAKNGKGASELSRFFRVSRIKKGVRIIGLHVDDAIRVLKGMTGGKAAKEATELDDEEDARQEVDNAEDLAPVHEVDRPDQTSWSKSWGKWSWASVITLVLSTVLIMVAPFLGAYTFEGVAEVIMNEMDPFP